MGHRPIPMDIESALTMKIVIEQGGLAPGLNLIAKHVERVPICRIFIAHIGAMDAFAPRIAAKIISDKRLSSMFANRYSSFDTAEFGKKVESGTSTLEELEAYAIKAVNQRNFRPTGTVRNDPESIHVNYFFFFFFFIKIKYRSMSDYYFEISIL